jgi:hypothetical protein
LERGVDLGELVFGAGQADVQSFDFTEPPLAGGLDDPGFQVVTDLFEPCTLRRVRSQERTSNTCLTEMILKGGLESCALRHARTVTGPDFGTTFPGRVGIRIYAVYGQALVSVQLQLTLALV